MSSLCSVPSYVKKLSDVFCNNTFDLQKNDITNALHFLHNILDVTHSSIYLSGGFLAIHAPKEVQKNVGELVIRHLSSNESKLNDAERQFLKEMKDFIALLVARKMLSFMSHFIQLTIDSFHKLANLRKATIFTARVISDDVKTHLIKNFSQMVCNNSIIPTFLIDDSMMGGFRIESNFLLIDKSIASKILAAKAQLAKS
ncbi:ATP synthase subunit delta [Candidatus Fokinia solitaria]|uniref:ATP synthase subunit delta n=1 Tax=Candidatus Fokinia solitaria TaxID=1802984 RepID=A0A2U8BRR9_9RICK|nr:F0F1 ATP synthase subunit delta [Candidatus Fokinia solitaria]AWD33044.1 ATP synthase subunit delta [Candidatus Fokinia solitaria]